MFAASSDPLVTATGENNSFPVIVPVFMNEPSQILVLLEVHKHPTEGSADAQPDVHTSAVPPEAKGREGRQGPEESKPAEQGGRKSPNRPRLAKSANSSRGISGLGNYEVRTKRPGGRWPHIAGLPTVRPFCQVTSP